MQVKRQYTAYFLCSSYCLLALHGISSRLNLVNPGRLFLNGANHPGAEVHCPIIHCHPPLVENHVTTSGRQHDMRTPGHDATFGECVGAERHRVEVDRVLSVFARHAVNYGEKKIQALNSTSGANRY